MTLVTWTIQFVRVIYPIRSLWLRPIDAICDRIDLVSCNGFRATCFSHLLQHAPPFRDRNTNATSTNRSIMILLKRVLYAAYTLTSASGRSTLASLGTTSKRSETIVFLKFCTLLQALRVCTFYAYVLCLSLVHLTVVQIRSGHIRRVY